MLGLLNTLIKVKKKKENTILDYIQGIKIIIDKLSMIGHPLNDREIVIHLFNVLGPK